MWSWNNMVKLFPLSMWHKSCRTHYRIKTTITWLHYSLFNNLLTWFLYSFLFSLSLDFITFAWQKFSKKLISVKKFLSTDRVMDLIYRSKPFTLLRWSRRFSLFGCVGRCGRCGHRHQCCSWKTFPFKTGTLRDPLHKLASSLNSNQ